MTLIKKQFKETFGKEINLFNTYNGAYDVRFEVRYILDGYDLDEGGKGFYVEIKTFLDDTEKERNVYDVAESKAHTFYASKEIVKHLEKLAETNWTKEVYC